MRPVTQPRIIVPDQVPQAVVDVFPEYSRAIVQLLYDRGLTTQEAVDEFLHPEYHDLHDPYLFKDMARAVERLYDAIAQGQCIAIHGDYDADGVCGAAVLQSVLRALGARTIVFLPHREKDGYGLNLNTVEYLHGEKAELIITCDCGISNAPEIARAKELGIDTIVTDHHQIPERVPDAFAIIHPKLSTEPYPFKQLAGGGVAFKLAQGLLRSQRCTLEQREREIQEKWLLDLVAISTVADMVELTGENRVLVTYGLLVMSKNRRLGLRELFSTAGIDPRNVHSETIAFQVAPRINAAGRMDHANTAYMLLTASEQSEAHQLVQLLEKQNKDRQVTTERMFREALTLAAGNKRAAVVVFNKEWTAGLTGLLAGKLVKEFKKPAFALGYDGSRVVGSGRSPDGISVMNGLLSVRDQLLTYGGHPQACGFRFDEQKLPAVTEQLYSFFDAELGTRAVDTSYHADSEVTLEELSWEFVDTLQSFQPFGQGNPEPVLYSRGVEILETRYVGKTLNHLRLSLRQNAILRKGIAFSMPGLQLKPGQLIDVLYTVCVNEWNGNRDIQLTITHIFPHE